MCLFNRYRFSIDFHYLKEEKEAARHPNKEIKEEREPTCLFPIVIPIVIPPLICPAPRQRTKIPWCVQRAFR